MDSSVPINEEDTGAPLQDALRPCRRCRNLFDSQESACPFCGALNRDVPQPATKAAAGLVGDRALMTVCVCYAVILGMDVLWGLAISHADVDWPGWYLFTMLVNDVIFVSATLIAWWKTRELTATLDRTLPRAASLAIALPMLVLALGMNMAYHRVLHEFGDFMRDEDYATLLGSVNAAVLMICVEPALFEELFFRGVAWKSLRHHMGPHATVLVTSAMFGMAHIGVPMSVPALFAVGVVFGYLRLWSGSLWLSMILHFLHNLFIVLYPDF